VRFIGLYRADSDLKIGAALNVTGHAAPAERRSMGCGGPDKPMAKKIRSKDTYALESGALGNGVMSPAAFRYWRKSLKMSQKAAAEALGLKRRVVQYYEKGERDGVPVVIPKTVRLACYALAAGQQDYPGPEES